MSVPDKVMKLKDGKILYDDLRNRVNNSAPVIKNAASGSIASFSDGAEGRKIDSLVVNIEPVQDLHGYDSPWPAGGGKNLADSNEVYLISINSSGDYVDQPGGEYRTLKVGELKAGTYTVSTDMTNPYWVRYRYVYDGTVVANGSINHGSVSSTFTLDNDVTDFGITLRKTDTSVISESFWIQLESGSAATTYSPYSNLCPISGWAGCEVQAAGKNLAKIGNIVSNGNGTKDITDNSITVYSSVETAAYRSAYVHVADVFKFAGETLTLSLKAKQTQGTANPRVIGKYYVNGSIVGSNLFEKTGTNITHTLTVPSDVESGTSLVLYLYCDSNAGGPSETEFTEIQLERGSDVTTFEPYQGSAVAVSWETEAGTVFNGDVDIISGRLRALWADVDLGSLTWSKYNTANVIFRAKVPGIEEPSTTAERLIGFLCSTYKASTGTDIPTGVSDKSALRNQDYIYIKDTSYADSTASEFATAMSGVKLVYKLAEPVEYTLPGNILTTLLGQNNLWASCGSIAYVVYSADTKTYVDDAADVPVTDVQVNGTSVVQDGVANVPMADSTNPGVAKISVQYGIKIESGILKTNTPTASEIKLGTNGYKPLTPANQNTAAFYGLAKAAGDSTQSASSNAVGTYTESAKSAIQSMLGVSQMLAPVESDTTADRAYAIGEIFSHNGKLYQATDAIAQDGTINPGINCQEVTIVSALPHDVQVNGTSVVSDGVANVPMAIGGSQSTRRFGVVSAAAGDHGIQITNSNLVAIYPASTNDIKVGSQSYRAVPCSRLNEAAFYGLAKAAGDTTQSQSNNAVGTYTDEAKGAIQSMLGVSDLIAPAENTLVASKAYAVNDIFTANGKLYKVTTAISADDTIVLQNEGETVSGHNAEECNISGTYIRNDDYAYQSHVGVVKIANQYGIDANSSNGTLLIKPALSSLIKNPTGTEAGYKPIVPNTVPDATFYGLAKAAGDATQSASNNAVGTYTDEAKAAIKSMLGVVDGSTGTVDVSGTTPTISAIENTRYICGEVSTLTVTPASSGVSIIRFTSGTTPTVLTATGVTWPEWFDADNLEADTVYEICITDGTYGAVMTWPL